jgi:hypothetical protein
LVADFEQQFAAALQVLARDIELLEIDMKAAGFDQRLTHREGVRVADTLLKDAQRFGELFLRRFYLSKTLQGLCLTQMRIANEGGSSCAPQLIDTATDQSIGRPFGTRVA